MKTSYSVTELSYGDLLGSIIFSNNPKKIIEFGILDGFSLKKISESCSQDCQIMAYDIFEEFKGNGAVKSIIDTFKENNNVKIEYGNFYQKHNDIENTSVDIIHIDIANDASVYKFAIENYFEKLKEGGFLILEGGSSMRDLVWWMRKYNKPHINPYLNNLNLRWKTIGKFPSITIIFKE